MRQIRLSVAGWESDRAVETFDCPTADADGIKVRSVHRQKRLGQYLSFLVVPFLSTETLNSEKAFRLLVLDILVY